MSDKYIYDALDAANSSRMVHVRNRDKKISGTIAKTTYNGIFFISVAQCNKKDQGEKEIGRRVARQRLFNLIAQYCFIEFGLENSPHMVLATKNEQEANDFIQKYRRYLSRRKSR